MPAWKKAGEIAASLRREGITIPLSDLIVASLAISEGCEVFTVDSHFEYVKELHLHCFPSQVLTRPVS